MLYFQTRLHKTVLFFFTPLGITHIFSLVLIKKKRKRKTTFIYVFDEHKPF